MVVTDLSRRRLMASGGGILLAGVLPIGVHMRDWGRGHVGAGAHRYERAEEFFRGLAAGLYRDPRDILYQAGIVAQLGITAFLLERGVSDDWCRQQLGLHVDRALAIANRLGLDHRRPEMLALAGHLSPYGVWRQPGAAELPKTVPLDPRAVSAALRNLLVSVRPTLLLTASTGTVR